MKKHGNKRKLTAKHSDVAIELTAIMIDDDKTFFQPQTAKKDVKVQTELQPFTYPDEKMDDQEINRVSSHRFTSLHLTTYEETLLDQGQTIVARENFDTTPNVSLTNNRRIVEMIAQKPTSTVANMINDAKADLLPIVGYADEPLLLLFKACTPLTNIIYDLSFYVQMALNQTPEQPADGLTIDESAAIRLYTLEWNTLHPSLYEMLNCALKKDDRELLRPYFKHLKLLLTALVKLPCVPSLTIWRGVTKNLSAEFPPGTSVTWWAFSSCTTALPVLENNDIWATLEIAHYSLLKPSMVE